MDERHAVFRSAVSVMATNVNHRTLHSMQKALELMQVFGVRRINGFSDHA